MKILVILNESTSFITRCSTHLFCYHNLLPPRFSFSVQCGHVFVMFLIDILMITLSKNKNKPKKPHNDLDKLLELCNAKYNNYATM